MTTWYDPDEIKAQADGAQVQPEFDPSDSDEPDRSLPWVDRQANTEGEQTVQKIGSMADRLNEISGIVDAMPNNGFDND